MSWRIWGGATGIRARKKDFAAAAAVDDAGGWALRALARLAGYGTVLPLTLHFFDRTALTDGLPYRTTATACMRQRNTRRHVSLQHQQKHQQHHRPRRPAAAPSSPSPSPSLTARPPGQHMPRPRPRPHPRPHPRPPTGARRLCAIFNTGTALLCALPPDAACFRSPPVATPSNPRIFVFDHAVCFVVLHIPPAATCCWQVATV
ncbi:uncharacterized protein J3D65DRAFT_384116 [Phyllosticta citribraziliensis]|uniref:Uncharacterized protein n=1 Tax=Phyllosticta citribraziliensis TaxID=989973 RepID=A0ABR1LQN2_9PEZI